VIFRASEVSACLRPLGYRDRQPYILQDVNLRIGNVYLKLPTLPTKLLRTLLRTDICEAELRWRIISLHYILINV
jgi:hypothetical protein